MTTLLSQERTPTHLLKMEIYNMAKRYKYAFDNSGALVVSDGVKYIGFATGRADEAYLLRDIIPYFHGYRPYIDAAIELAGIDKITDWIDLGEY